jgi:(p)ppGpp synthase/HD superfamily hydrolase
MDDLNHLKNIVLAPYILKATALIGVQRKVGGNQFRHSFSTLGILLDYKYFNDHVLLKAALLHDLFEELPNTMAEEIKIIDTDGPKVVELVMEVTRRAEESKVAYLERIASCGSRSAKLLKCADRISNLTDLHRDTHDVHKFVDYLDQTERYIIPMAIEVDENMALELADLLTNRRIML